MANSPLLTATCKITAKDINGNNIAKQFNSVRQLIFDYTDATVNIVDVTGSFYFSLSLITSLTYTVTGGAASGTTTVVMS